MGVGGMGGLKFSKIEGVTQNGGLSLKWGVLTPLRTMLQPHMKTVISKARIFTPE